MRPFDRPDSEPCPKCDGGNLVMPSTVTRYRWDFRWADAHYGDFYSPERLDVTCPTCGYSFEMEPADAKVPA